MTLFKGKYRNESARLRGWDYRWDGWYFITICTQYRRCWFGDIIDKTMRLSIAGHIVRDELLKTPLIRSSVWLDEWIIMPNHLHAIMVINHDNGVGVGTSRRDVPTPVQWDISPMQPMPPRLQSASLGAIVNQCKSICTKRIRAVGYVDFAWQPRFHDSILRTPEAIARVRSYIRQNPRHWEQDALFNGR
ncbi:transposase [Candidatus Peregrinibacteria bacterium]|nr:transposase [Candidatus Peregrinibacteria bacterium]MBI3816389.1 transposase [Candidatus Peregrinibacteria bacterium]